MLRERNYPVDSWADRHREVGRKEGLEQGLEKGREEGLEQGLEKGREEGRALGAVEVLEMQLTARFGSLPDEAKARLRAADATACERWSVRLLTAPTLDDVFAEA